MSLAVMKGDLQCEAITWLSGDECARPGAGCASRPAFAWLDPRSSIGGPQSEVDFVGRLAFERDVRSMFVVPGEEDPDLSDDARSAQRNQDSAKAFVLQCSDEPLNHGDTSMLPRGAVPRPDCRTPAPSLKRVAPEDRVLVGDEVFGRCVAAGDCPAEERANGV